MPNSAALSLPVPTAAGPPASAAPDIVAPATLSSGFSSVLACAVGGTAAGKVQIVAWTAPSTSAPTTAAGSTESKPALRPQGTATIATAPKRGDAGGAASDAAAAGASDADEVVAAGTAAISEVDPLRPAAAGSDAVQPAGMQPAGAARALAQPPQGRRRPTRLAGTSTAAAWPVMSPADTSGSAIPAATAQAGKSPMGATASKQVETQPDTTQPGVPLIGTAQSAVTPAAVIGPAVVPPAPAANVVPPAPLATAPIVGRGRALSLAADADTVPGAATASVTPPAAPGVAGAPATLPPVANTAAGSATLSSVAEQAVTPGNGGVTGTPAAAVLASGQPLLLAREQRVAAAGPGVGGLASDGTAAPSAAVAPLLPQPALGTAGMPADATALPVALVAPEAAAAVPAASAGMSAPAVQIAPALVSLVQTPGGAQRLTLRLQPPELGQVQIQIDRPSDAPARVEITVQRPETLTLLLRDQPQLQRALDQAGVPPDGRSLTFHVSPPTGSSGNGAGGPGSFAGSGGGADSSGSGGQNAQAEMDDAGEDAAAAAVPVPQRWLRAGLDITA